MTLEQLSAAAAQGTMDIAAGANCHCFDGRLVVGGKCIAFVSGDQTEDDDGEFHIIADADGQFIAELWNAYRTGQLVAVQPEQPTCMLCAGKCRGHSLADSKAWEPEPGSQAFAVQPDDATVEQIVKAGLSVATIGTPSEIAVQIAHNTARAAIAAMPSQAALQAEIERLRIELQNIAETTDDDITSRQAFEALSKGPRP